MKSIVVLSGKGGVGKSSITASLAVSFSKENKIVCADCDVDASNLSLLFALSEDKYVSWEKLSTNKIAIIDYEKCINCGKCLEICHFNAIKLKDEKRVVSEFGCEGCGACELICPVNAITLENIDNALIGYAKTNYGFKIASAQLQPGNSGSGKVVSKVRSNAKEIEKDADFLIIDSAAGIGCPVIASVTGTDYAVIVTEPTPSGFSDLKKAIEIVNHFKINKGIIINKYDVNPSFVSEIEKYAKENSIKIISKIPYDKNFVKAMVEMIPVIDFNKKYEILFDEIKKEILNELE